MRHLLLFFILSLFTVFNSFAQVGSVKGVVIDSETANPVTKVRVQVSSSDIETYTNKQGEFILENVPEGAGIIILTNSDYETKQVEFMLNSGEVLDLGSVEISYSTNATGDLPMVVLEESDLEEESTQAMSGLLQSSDDVFSEVAAYTFGAVRFRARGYDSRNTAIYFNGIEMNNLENGRPKYSDWGGINDVLRNKEIYFGQDENDLSLSYLGGGVNIITRASDYRPGIKVSYMNRLSSYKNRVMATASTGLMDNNWAFTVSGSHRWAQEGYVEGTFYDAWAYFLAAEKRINDKNTISLTAFVTPNKRGKPAGAPQEIYDLEDNNYYNANWGYQNGEKRNARVANTMKPYIMLNYEWEINEKMNLNASASYSFGRDGNTALTWGDAKDPRPTYYRYLPHNSSDPTAAWVNSQIRWDSFYQANSDEYYLLENADGIVGKDIYGLRSKYMIEDRRIDHSQISANVNFKYELNKELTLAGNVNYTNYKGRHFKVVDDLLGGEFWLDIDKFALGDIENSDQLQSDLNHPNRAVKEGDVFGYDYDANITKMGGFVKSDYSIDNLDLYLGIGISNTSFYRTGNMRVGKFPDNSYGDSEKQNFLNYNINGGLTYKITGRHIVYANGSYQTRAPYFENAYVAPRTRDQIVDGLTDEKIMSFDVNYLARMPYLTGRFSAFYTTFKDQTDVMSFYHDAYKTFVNYAMTGIDKKHLGIEFGLKGNVTSTINVTGVASIGQYTYSSRPKVSVSRDNDSQPPPELGDQLQTVYVKNYRVDGTPQTALSLGLEYRAPKYWWVSADINYFDNIYLSFNPARRTEAAVEGLDLNSDLVKNILSQERLPSAYTLNLKGGKSWRFDKYYVSIFAVMNNVLDNQKVSTGGYEQLRFDYDYKDLDKYPSYYYYMYGRTYMLILTLSF